MPQTKPSLPSAEKLKHGISLNSYLPFDKLWIKDELEQAAKEENRSTSELVVMALEEFVSRRKSKSKSR